MNNPYAPPAEHGPSYMQSVDPTMQLPAERGPRFVAALIDALAGIFVIFPIEYAAGLFDGFPNIKMSIDQRVLWGAAGIAIWMLLHGYFLRNGQTIGKKLMKLQMVSVHDGKPLPVLKLLLLRHLPISLVAQIPYVGALLSLIDILFIFASDRRCIHDKIAGTRVVAVFPMPPPGA